MEFIQSYASDDNATNDSDKELHQRAVRSVYLVTYSQADMTKFPTRETFANEVVKYFQSTKVNVLHWVCCIEEHESNGQHFHLALKLSKNKRWLPVKRKMKNNHNVVLHFSDSHVNYYTAWCYVTKSDKSYLQSVGHPDLKDATAPQTSNACQANCHKR